MFSHDVEVTFEYNKYTNNVEVTFEYSKYRFMLRVVLIVHNYIGPGSVLIPLVLTYTLYRPRQCVDSLSINLYDIPAPAVC